MTAGLEHLPAIHECLQGDTKVSQIRFPWHSLPMKTYFMTCMTILHIYIYITNYIYYIIWLYTWKFLNKIHLSLCCFFFFVVLTERFCCIHLCPSNSLKNCVSSHLPESLWTLGRWFLVHDVHAVHGWMMSLMTLQLLTLLTKKPGEMIACCFFSWLYDYILWRSERMGKAR